MKRYGIYITVILIILSCSHYNAFSQLNSSIESITMTYPIEDTIYDPAGESMIIQIELDSYFIWENNVPDSIGFFSAPDNYSWIEKEVTNATIFQPEYKSVSPVYLFNKEINPVYFWLYDPDNEIDTVSVFQITYNKPQVELVAVAPADQVPGTATYVVYESRPLLTINAESWFPSVRPDSYITKIQLKDEDSPGYLTLWEDPAGVGQNEISVVLPVNFTLEPGLEKNFSIRAIGRTAAGYTGPAESSDEVSFKLTFLSIDVPDTICQVNSSISLNAYPPGGTFEGKGIIDNTNLFNPYLADANAYNPISYRHIIEGTEFTVMTGIYVINLPVIDLDGQLEVCANSTDVKYTILNAEISKYDYIWNFTGVAEVLDSTDVSRTVRWQDDPVSYTGKISISLEGKNETQCPASFDYLVDIDPDDAPDKPCVCFGDQEKRLLLASNTDAVHYNWYIHDGAFIGYTLHPYFYLTDEIRVQNNIGESTRFEVHISNQLTGCYTIGYMCEDEMCNEIPQANISPKNALDGLSVAVRENPVHNKLWLETEGSFSGNFTLGIYSLNGSLISSSVLTKSQAEAGYNINLDTGIKAGFYLLVCQYGNSFTSPVKLIVY